MERPRVLIVDDETSILSLFVRAFRKEFDITTATSGPEALELLEGRDFDVVVIDYAMETMNGVEVAERTATLKPEAVRILVTGHHELPVVREALARGIVADVVAKPWVPRDLSRVIRAWC